MALQKEISFNGLSSQTGYFRIMEVTNSRRRNVVVVEVHGYANADFASQENAPGITLVVYEFPYSTVIDDGNVIASAYLKLKELSEFSEAQDA